MCSWRAFRVVANSDHAGGQRGAEPWRINTTLKLHSAWAPNHHSGLGPSMLSLIASSRAAATRHTTDIGARPRILSRRPRISGRVVEVS